MFGRITSLPWNSIRVKLVVGLLMVTLPLIGLLLYNYYYSVNVIHNQVANSNHNLISIHMKQIDEQLSEVERHMTNLAMNDSSLLAMGELAGMDEYMMAKSAVSRLLDSSLLVYPYIDGFIVYSRPRKDMVETFRYRMNYEETLAMRRAMTELIEHVDAQPRYSNVEWAAVHVNGKHHFVRLVGDGGVYMIASVRAESLVKPLRDMNTGESGAVLLVDDQGGALFATREIEDEGLDLSSDFKSYYLSGAKQDYLIVGQTSQRGKFSLVAAVPDKLILQNLPYLARAAFIVIMLALFMLPLSLYFLRKVLLLPLRKMMTAMRFIGEGNFRMQIEESATPEEFQLVNRTFNQMISQIEELKINVYEEQLSKQRAELQHLQLQINPHFFMNSLNIMYNLAQVKQYDLIQQMSLSLVHYFRYMLQSNHPLVLLKEELQHVRNFLNIQQLRFPDILTCDYRVPDYLLTAQIPPLALQTVVENTIKHGMQANRPLTLTIEAELDELAEEPMVIVSIRDTGKGFSDEALESVRMGERLIDEKGEHFGLWNISERLKLQYGESAWMECYNDDSGGAVVELAVPLNPNQTRTEGAGDVPVIDR